MPFQHFCHERCKFRIERIISNFVHPLFFRHKCLKHGVCGTFFSFVSFLSRYVHDEKNNVRDKNRFFILFSIIMCLSSRESAVLLLRQSIYYRRMIYMEESTIQQDEVHQFNKQLLIYLLKCILLEGSKALLLFVIFFKFDLVREYLVALFFLMLLRNNGGGIHFKHYLSCFAVSFFVLFASIYGAILISLPKLFALGILTICGCMGYKLVPIVSENRPEPSQKLIKRTKRNTCLILLLLFILICICPHSLYLDIGVWTVMIHICQLLLAKFLQRR